MPSAQHLIRELIDESIRARRRRLHLTGSDGSNSSDSGHSVTLQQLKAVDTKLDHNIRALAAFGTQAIDACAETARTTSAADQDAAMHLWCAVAVQAPYTPATENTIAHLVQKHSAAHWMALRDALWFFPVGFNEFDIRHDHILPLLTHPDPTLQCLGAELAGRRGVRYSAAVLQHLRQNTPPDKRLHRACELALTRLNVPLNDWPRRIHTLMAGSPQDRQHALQLITIQGSSHASYSAQHYLELTQDPNPITAAMAWNLLALLDPLLAHTQAMQDSQSPLSLRTCILALAGYPQGLVHTIANISASQQPPSTAQNDLLWLTLGNIPVAVKATPVDADLREQQLRQSVLQCFRHSHISAHNHADTCAWEPQHFIATPLEKTARLRYGRRMVQPQPEHIPHMLALRLSLNTLQALYVEQAHRIQSVFGFGISAYANARQQLALISSAEWISEHLQVA